MDNNLQTMKDFIRTQGQKKVLKKKASLFRVHDPVKELILLESGYVKITQETESGHMMTLAIRTTEDLCGMSELLTEKRNYSRNAFCITDCTFFVISAEQFHHLMAHKPHMWQELCKLLAVRHIQSQQFMYVLTQLSVQERLRWMLQKYTVTKAGKVFTTIPFTHEQIGQLLGCSRQKVTHYLNEWRALGFIDYDRKKIDVLQPAILFHGFEQLL